MRRPSSTSSVRRSVAFFVRPSAPSSPTVETSRWGVSASARSSSRHDRRRPGADGVRLASRPRASARSNDTVYEGVDLNEIAGERLHGDSFVLDLHIHGPGFVPQPFGTAWRALTAGAPAELGFDALRVGGVDAAVAMAVGDPIVTRWYLGRGPWDAVEAQLVRLERQAAGAGAVVVRTVEGMLQARMRDRPAVLLGVEGGDALGHDVDRIDLWHQRGVRTIGLVHLGDNTLGTTCLSWQQHVRVLPVRRTTHQGLSAFGARAVERMNQLGVLVDVAHCDRKTLLGVVDAASAPVVSSHSGARALQDFPRYLTDDE